MHQSGQKQLLHSYEIQLMLFDLEHRQNYPRWRILQGSGVSSADLQNPAFRLTLEQELHIYTAIAKANRDPLMSLRVGSRLGLPNYGILGAAIMLCSSVRGALELISEFAPLVSWASHSSLRTCAIAGERDSGMALVVHPTPGDPATSTLEVQSTFASLLTLFTELAGDDFRFSAVEFAHETSLEHHASFQDHFGCQIQFDAPQNTVLFSRRLLNRRLPHAQPEYADLLRDLCRDSMQALRQDRGLVAAIRSFIENREQGTPNLDETARYFHMSSRTLRRHLRERGVSYRTLVEEARFTSAKRYLSSTGMTVESIGKRLGYADVRSFRTAFKRWAGVAPVTYRQRLRTSPAQT